MRKADRLTYRGKSQEIMLKEGEKDQDLQQEHLIMLDQNKTTKVIQVIIDGKSLLQRGTNGYPM